jgi:hypothetical protein
VLKLQGIDSISDAEKYVGADVRIPTNELLPPEAGSFYTFQLKDAGFLAPAKRSALSLTYSTWAEQLFCKSIRMEMKRSFHSRIRI